MFGINPLANRAGVATAVFFLAAWMDGSASWAGDARVLPKGRTRISFIAGASASVSQAYDGEGNRQSVASPYNVKLDSANLTGFQPQLADLIQFMNDTGLRYNEAARNGPDHGVTTDSQYPLVGDALSAGMLEVDAQARKQQYNLLVQHGITDRMSLGLLLPYVRAQVRVRSSMSGVNTAGDIYHAFENTGSVTTGTGENLPVAAYLDQLRSLTPETFQSLLMSRGYSRFQDYDGNGLGDLTLGARYNYFKGAFSEAWRKGYWISSAQIQVSAPTGKLRKPSELTAVDYGLGAWEASLSHATNFKPSRRFTFAHSLGYAHRLGSHRTLRVRSTPGDMLPDASSEETVSMNLGQRLWTGAGLSFSASDVVGFWAEMQWEWKTSDRYQGSRTDRSYGYLSENTRTFSETLTFGTSLSSVRSFLKKTFSVPADINITVNLLLRGRNVPDSSYGTLELAFYL